MEKKILKHLNKNRIVAFPTDTVFAFIVKLEKQNIQKINELKHRPKDQPLQILINNLNQLDNVIDFSVISKDFLKNSLRPKTSYIVKVKESFANEYLLDTFKKTVMFRIPNGDINEIISKIGPVFASSVNLNGEKVIDNNNEIKKRFKVLTSKKQQNGSGKSSKIISFLDNEIKIIREG